jgi:hypothetical protein
MAKEPKPAAADPAAAQAAAAQASATNAAADPAAPPAIGDEALAALDEIFADPPHEAA